MTSSPHPIPIAQQADYVEPNAALRALVRALARQAAADLLAGMREGLNPEPADAETPTHAHSSITDR